MCKSNIECDIRNLFDGLSALQLNYLVDYYYKNLGGEDGCEECYETNSLCSECYFELSILASKLRDPLYN